jgi:hypothetical protein
METKTYITVDKTGWQPGPWKNEPDKVQWQDEATGLPCLAVRNHMGAWCGYVGVAEGHKYFDKHYDEANRDGVSVHGGLTFARFCYPNPNEAEDICHVPGEGEPDRVWWLGFDCAHHKDLCPADTSGMFRRGTYRDLAYVQGECRSLALQLKP